MNHVSQTVYSYSSSHRKFPSIAIEELSNEEKDQILDSYPVLIAENYRGYYIKKLEKLGKKQFVRLAERAMKYGSDKQKLFAHLMK